MIEPKAIILPQGITAPRKPFDVPPNHHNLKFHLNIAGWKVADSNRREKHPSLVGVMIHNDHPNVEIDIRKLTHWPQHHYHMQYYPDGSAIPHYLGEVSAKDEYNRIIKILLDWEEKIKFSAQI